MNEKKEELLKEMTELLERLSHALYAEDGDEWAAEIRSLLEKASKEGK